MFTRGFKSWCEQVARQQRRELNLLPTDPLDPKRLAAHHGIDVWTPEDVPDFDSECLHTLLVEDPNSWSAVTLSVDSKHLIILNPTHSAARCASDMCHEISHVLIGHEPARLYVSEDGIPMLSTYDKKQEEEANWLSGCLLLPREALMVIRRRRISDDAATSKYGVSSQMLRFRFSVSGVDTQLKRMKGN